ncbi:CdaR family transcriptional regulator [Desulfitobacterium sp. LBE]|uniref:Transcriptional regulator, CdaR n=2 Tax=root TaxID=1 RepID=B8G0W7_DESHD|nr:MULTISPECIES: helix-turn-helix domain-containing protein [Desulfitobacterium]ACL18386.1 transcriptional regulator, CdaR [Desulfitobacterium hafniense DCB-2]MEA5023674.1 helix-turn-helix domain-containing protein [Desulfitobacterium hafniense]TWH58686.1 CdaR family transcriptional regulator [Desulfitobacterium sp. LBE]
MKLNLAVFAYHLADYAPRLYDSEVHGLGIGDVRFIDRQETFLSESVYIGAWDKLQALIRPPSYVVCIGRDETTDRWLEKHGVKALILDSEVELNEVFERLQDIFQHYNRLESELLEAVLCKEPLNVLLNICAKFFANPTFITDAALCLVATCDNFAHPETDRAWQETIESGRSSSELLLLMKRKKLTNLLNTSRKAEFVNVGENYSKIICANYFDQEVRIATFTVSEAYTPLSPLQAGLVDHVAKLLTAEVRKQHKASSRYLFAIRSNISNLLHGQKIDGAILKTNFAHIGWTDQEDYRLLKIPLTAAELADGTAGHNRKIYESIFPHYVSLDLNEVLILVIRCARDTEADKRRFAELKKHLKNENAACGVSKTFHDFDMLGEEYKLANAALEIGSWKYPKEALYFYEDMMLEHLFSEGSRIFNLRSLCHDSVLRIAEHDQQNNSSLLQTLKVYLLQEKSLLAASQELHIHRNTLVYRLGKIEQISGLDLNSPLIRLQGILSCLILEYLNGLEEKAPD